MLTVNSYKLPFVDFKGLLDTGTYRLLIPGLPPYINLFAVRTNSEDTNIYTAP